MDLNIQLEKNKHISTTEVLRDIADTEKEIRELTKEVEERRKFIADLRELIHARDKEECNGI